MRLVFIFLVLFFGCTHPEQVEQENSKSQLTILSEAISEDPTNVISLAKRADYFLSNDNFESALMDYKECLALDVSNIYYHYQAAFLYYEIAKTDRTKKSYPDKAKYHLEELLRIQENYIPALLLKGELHLVYYLASKKHDELQEAISYLNQVIDLDYSTARAHLLKGYIYASLQEEEKAIQFFHNVVDIDPTEEDAYIQLGLIYQKREDSTAVVYYKNTLSINPENKLALYNLGKFYQDNEDWNESIKYYTNLLQIYPTFSDGYYNLGFVHIKLGLYDIAVNDFANAISFNRNFHEAYYSRGYCYETLGDVYRAELDYRKASEIDPNYQNAKDALNALLLRNQEIQK